MANNNTGVIVARLPSREYTDKRQTIVDHHLTIAWLGKIDDPDINDKSVKNFWDMMGKLWELKLKAQVAGETVFPIGSSMWAHVDLIDAPFLPDLRAIVAEAIDVTGLPLDRTHGFIPHITRRYVQNPQPVELTHRADKLHFSLDKLVLWRGDKRLETNLR